MLHLKKISVALSLFMLSLLAFSTVSLATITLDVGNESTAPVNQVLLNFTWRNSTPVTNSDPTWNATANITFTLPAGINYVNGTSNLTIATTNMTGGMNFSIPNSTATTVIFGNGSAGTPISNDTIDTSGWLAFNISANASGTYVITVNETYLVDNGTNQFNVSTNITLSIINGTITLTDATFINVTYNGIPTQMNFTGTASAATGGGTISDDITYILYMNTTAALVNNTGGTTNGLGVINYTNATAGLYTFVFNTIGTSNYSATTLTAVLNISRAIPTLELFINGDPNNMTIAYGISPEIKGNATFGNNTVVPEPTMNIYVANVTESSPNVNSITSSGNAAILGTLFGNGTYVITYNTSGNNNFTSASNNSLYLIVNKGILNGTYSGSNVTYPTSVSVIPSPVSSGVADTNFTLWRNGTLISFSLTLGATPAADTTKLGGGAYQYILNSTGGANWTSNSSMLTYLVVVSQGTPGLSLDMSPSSSVSQSTISIVTGSGCPTIGIADLTCRLTRNGNVVTSPDSQRLGVGTYTYAYATGGGANWSSATVSGTLSVTLSTADGGTTGGGAVVTQTGTTQTVVTPSVPQVTVTINKVSASIEKISPSTPAEVTITKSDTGVSSLDISVKNAVSSVAIDINKIDQLPPDITTPSGKIYKQLNIVKGNLTDADVDKITIKFSVEKSWLAANNIDANKVKLQRYANGQWTSLPATKLSEDSEFVYYSAETPGLSYFVVSGEEATTTPAAVSQPSDQSQLYYALAAVAVVAIGLVAYKMSRKKGKRK